MALQAPRAHSLVASLVVTVAAMIAIAGPAAGTADASACGRFGSTEAQKLSGRAASRSVECLINSARHRHGLRGLSSNRRLDTAAGRHTRYMTRHHCFSHQCPGEGSLVARFERVNYIVGGLRAWSIGENIAWGTGSRGTPKAIVGSWMHSPPHRANILDPRFRHLGVGFARGAPAGGLGGGGTYTTDFGMRKG